MDTPCDGTDVRYSPGDWLSGGLGVDTWFRNAEPVRDGDVAVAIDGYRLAGGVGSVPGDVVREGAVLRYGLLRDGEVMEVQLALVRPDMSQTFVPLGSVLLYLTLLGLLAMWLRVRRPDAPTGTPLFLAFAGIGAWLIAGPVVGLTALDVATGSALFWLYHVATLGGGTLGWGAMVALSLSPLRTHLPGRYEWLRRAAYTGPLLLVAGWAGVVLLWGPGGLPAIGLVHAGQEVVVMACWLAAGWLSLAVYRRSRASRRAPQRWVLGGGLLTGLGLFGLWLVPDVVLGQRPTTMMWVGLSGLPIMAGMLVAILHYRLYAIERFLSRGLQYAALIAVLSGCYLVVTAVAASAAASDTLTAGAAAVAVALLALPVRQAIRHHTSRRFFGGREDPAQALRALGRTLARIPSPQQALPHIVASVREALRLPYGAVELADSSVPGGFWTAESQGAAVGEMYLGELRYQGRTVGRLVVSAREADEPLTAADRALLTEVADQLGAAVHAVVAYEEVLRSRTAAVSTREDERRRLRGDLHDNLSPVLTGLSLKNAAALGLLDGPLADVGESPRGDAAGTAEVPRTTLAGVTRLLTESAAIMHVARGDLRRLVEGLRPPALDELGLTGAVRLRARELTTDTDDSPRIAVTGPDRETALPAAQEVAAYRIAVEAVSNVIRHARATRCTVRISCSPHPGPPPTTDAAPFAPPDPGPPTAHRSGSAEPLYLHVDVCDDGVGLPADGGGAAPGVGVGLRSMRERAQELGGECTLRTLSGGGTAVQAVLPCPTSVRSDVRPDQPKGEP